MVCCYDQVLLHVCPVFILFKLISIFLSGVPSSVWPVRLLFVVFSNCARVCLFIFYFDVP